MVFPNFLNFFAIFLEFSITSRVRTHQNNFFLFYIFRGLSKPILACIKPKIVFSNFFNFYTIFLEFSITGREETQRNDFLPFLSLDRKSVV